MKSYFMIILVFVTFCHCQRTFAANKNGKVVTCYYGEWSAYRQGAAKFEPENIHPRICTHLVLSFAGLDEQNNNIKSLDPNLDFDRSFYKRMTNLRSKNPKLKVLIAIGGWNEGSAKYSRLARNPEKRKQFVQNVVQFIRNYKFDGLDLDWEYPAQRDGAPEDKVNFVSLVIELRKEFNKFGYLLTAALGASKNTIDVSYDIQKLSKYLDYLHMMCYDYHGSWGSTIGANAPLYDGNNDQLSVHDTIRYLKESGVNLRKVVLGVPLYGKTFIAAKNPVTEQDIQNMNVQSTGNGFQGRFNLGPGFMGYNEICKEIDEGNGWKKVNQRKTRTPFLIKDNKVISYDDDVSIREKVRYAKRANLAGIMVWSIETDDFSGQCKHPKYKNYPLLRSIRSELRK